VIWPEFGLKLTTKGGKVEARELGLLTILLIFFFSFPKLGDLA